MKVKNMVSSRGNAVPNQFIIEDCFLILDRDSVGGRMFQSYDSNIAFRTYDGKVYLDSYYWDYSVTTGKYRNSFLNKTKKETQQKIDKGIYKLVDLNK